MTAPRRCPHSFLNALVGPAFIARCLLLSGGAALLRRSIGLCGSEMNHNNHGNPERAPGDRSSGFRPRGGYGRPQPTFGNGLPSDMSMIRSDDRIYVPTSRGSSRGRGSNARIGTRGVWTPPPTLWSPQGYRQPPSRGISAQPRPTINDNNVEVAHRRVAGFGSAWTHSVVTANGPNWTLPPVSTARGGRSNSSVAHPVVSQNRRGASSSVTRAVRMPIWSVNAPESGQRSPTGCAASTSPPTTQPFALPPPQVDVPAQTQQSLQPFFATGVPRFIGNLLYINGLAYGPAAFGNYVSPPAGSPSASPPLWALQPPPMLMNNPAQPLSTASTVANPRAQIGIVVTSSAPQRSPSQGNPSQEGQPPNSPNGTFYALYAGPGTQRALPPGNGQNNQSGTQRAPPSGNGQHAQSGTQWAPPSGMNSGWFSPSTSPPGVMAPSPLVRPPPFFPMGHINTFPQHRPYTPRTRTFDAARIARLREDIERALQESSTEARSPEGASPNESLGQLAPSPNEERPEFQEVEDPAPRENAGCPSRESAKRGRGARRGK
uniref:RING-type domain-containing protein n=1 Tax=Steinernema glaseri TaxID=37863 RepID=A0A1I8APZ7_9BILA